MDDEETAALLVAEDVPAGGALVAELSERTRGWALGAAVAARMMARAPSPEAVMADLDDVLDELIDRAAWSWLPAVGREIVLRTSVADEVSSDLARAVLRLDGPLPTDWVVHSRGFVQIGPGGSLHPHPLLRRCALRRLDRDWPAMARDARRTAAAWFVDHGERSVGVDLAARGGDRHWVAALLIDSLVVPSILLGATELPGSDLRGELGAGEPLLAAAVDAAAGRVAEADEELARAGAQPVRPGLVGGGLPRRLSEALVRMAIARHRVQPEAGLRLVAEGRRLSTQLSRAHRQLAPELSALLDAYEGAFLMFAGELDRAVAVVEPATRAISASVAGQVATTECAGLLACLEALRGNLTSAARHAAAVLTSRPADGDEPGVGYAQLAAAWVHLERRELNEARQRLVHAARTADQVREPWLAAMRKLAEARVATAGAEPDLALRRLSAMGRSAPVSAPGWLGDRRAVDLAEAHLAAGQPRRALAALTPEPARTLVEARAMAAAARRAIGDRRGARALLSAAEPRLPDAPLPAVVQVLSLQAQLAAEGADNERAAALARRALRTAGREELRTALSIGSPWLSAYVERHPDLLRLHGDLVAPLDGSRPPRQVTEGAAAGGIAPEPLTNRELQVLCRLGQLATTSEIAADLFVSANTVKTHVKSLFLKLAVNRRADAVRRGRELGLC
jgi:LuxR family maltose regulon positive regulatory protein